MSKRFIAFGCSFTSYDWATWADIIGVNFDDYLNFGKPSGSNMDTMHRFITMHDKYKFNKDDLIIVGITGFRRFSFFCKVQNQFRGFGDIKGYLENPDTTDYKTPLTHFYTNFYSDRTSVYYNHIATLSLKRLLESLEIPHKFFMAINNLEFLDHQAYEVIHMAKEIYNLCPSDKSLEEFKYKFIKKEIRFDDGTCDGHPSIETHMAFVQQYFPEFDTEISRNFADKMIKSFKTSSRKNQQESFEAAMKLYHRQTH